MNLAKGAQATLHGDNKIHLMGVQAKIADGATLTVHPPQQVTITATEMDDESPIKHGKFTYKHHLPTTIIG